MMNKSTFTNNTNVEYVPVSKKDFFYGVLKLTQDFNKSEELLQRTISEYEKVFRKKISSDRAKQRLRDYATTQLRDNMEAAGRVGSDRTTPHHIVAYDEPKGRIARRILAQVGININDEVNGVHLPILTDDTPHPDIPEAYPHKRVHTKIYYLNVADLLTEAFKENKGNKSEQKKEVEHVLRDIAKELTLGEFPLKRRIIS
jgi:hypothetical protein